MEFYLLPLALSRILVETFGQVAFLQIHIILMGEHLPTSLVSKDLTDRDNTAFSDPVTVVVLLVLVQVVGHQQWDYLVLVLLVQVGCRLP